MKFLTEEQIMWLHSYQIKMFGGSSGLRDRDLLLSAIAQAESTFEGDFLHKDIFEMAAAYLFHLCKNHPFVDGNKRVAFVACIVFLKLNGFSKHTMSEQEAYLLTIEVAKGKLEKKQITGFLKEKFSSPS